MAATAAAAVTWRGTNDSATEFCRRGNTPAAYGRYQRNNSTAPYATPPSNVARTTPHHRWYASGTGAAAATGAGSSGAAGGESTPSTPGGATERRRRLSGSGSSRSESSSPEPSDTSRASSPAAHHHAAAAHHTARRTPPPHPHQWPSTANGRPLAICVRNLPTRSTDSSLKDGLYHEYKKHGKVVWVKVVGQNADRYAVVRFKKPSDVEKALEVSQDKLFFGCKISVAPHQSCDDDAESAKPYETDIDEYHPKATRTLFIGNLEKDVTQQQLRDKFKHFGRIIEIDIKKGSGGGAGYAFCQYASISSVVEAIRAMDGEHVGSSRVKLGFGKPVATTCVWVDGLTEHTEKQVLGAVSRCGAATSVCVDRAAGAALVHFEQAAAAGGAVRELRRVAAQLSAAEPDHPRLCVDYASRECQEAFYEQLEKHGGSAALAGAERVVGDNSGRYISARHETIRYETGTSRSRAPSFGRSSSRTPRYNAHDLYDPADYAADRRYRVYDELGSSPQTDEATYEDRLQSVVVSPHRGHKHRRDSSPEDRKHSKERHRSAGGGSRRSRSGSRSHVSRRRHRRRRDGSGSRTSRAGTPLRDEPDAPPTEPRRPPRERPPLPMSLPLPKFAVQLLRAAPAQPRSLPPAPASPPRPPSASSSSGGSAPHSPSLEERIRSLDEKYERWSGSRAHADAPDRSRLRHRLLELDINEVKPSEVVRSLLAKRSVFDEDSERLEGARAPSPGGSPRSLAVVVPRVLRYPFPAHSGTVTAATTPSTSTATPGTPTRLSEQDDQDRTQPSSLERIPKLPDVETVNETRIRMRTPSIDKQGDMHEKKQSPSIDKEQFELDGNITRHENKSRRNSFVVNRDENKSPMITENTTDHRSLEHSVQIDIIEKPNMKDHRVGLEDKLIMIKTEDCSEDQKVLTPSESIINKFERNCFRDETKFCSEEINQAIKQELQVDLELSQNDIFFFPNEYDTKLQKIIQEDMKPKSIHDNKLHESGFREKKEIENLFKNHINKEIMTYNVHSTNHLNVINCSELSRKTVEVTPELKLNDKITKEKCDINNGPLLQDDKFGKENIIFEKAVDFVMVKSNFLLSVEKPLDNAINQNESNTNEYDRTRHSKDRIDKDYIEKEKLQNKNFKLEKNEKERKMKEDNHFVKSSSEKFDKSRTEKVVEKNLDTEKNVEKDRESDKPRYIDDSKTLRHDNHKKDKVERDKKRDITETESSVKIIKRDDKYKHDRTKKESDIKREIRPDHSKSRKSSRDESSRDISRKDSTDSSTSRTSHDSTKSRDYENTEIKEEPKNKVKNTAEIFHKVETDKDSIKVNDQPKSEGKIKIKAEIKEEKDQAHFKNKIDSYVENTLKAKSDGFEKQRHYSLDSPNLDSKRKERLNSCSSLPSNIGHKRRMSSQDSIDCLTEDTKKCKSDRRDSKDSRSLERHKTTKFSKGHFAKIIESKTKDDKKNQVKPPDDMFLNIKEDEIKVPEPEKTKTIKKSSLDESEEKSGSSGRGQQSGNSESSSESLHNNIDFLATLELRSSEEDERQKALRKEMKEKKRIQQLQQIQELQMQQDALQQAECNKIKDQDKKLKNDDKKKETMREKRMSTERKSKDDKNDNSKRRNRKQVPSTDSSDSDEPMKKHSIFDIIDDEPTYISMYDKVKARSCKNMQKQEEEKRQEKIKAKFSQLKQSRAKREEKKRSSWDEDSDSENEQRKSHKASMGSSSDDDQIGHGKKREKSHGSSLEYDQIRTNDYFDAVSNEDDSHNKLSRKNSRSRIMSDTSDDENINRKMNKSPNFVDKIKKEIFSDSESSQKCKDTDIHLKESSDDKVKKTSLRNLFGKSDSEDNRLKSILDSENDYRISFPKSFSNDISSGNESIPSNLHSSEMRKKHKKKQKKYKFSFSDEDTKTESGHEAMSDMGVKRKSSEKFRRHSNKKDKRKDKTRESVDTDEPRDEKIKYKKDKRSPSQCYDLITDTTSNNHKKEGKMEDIFGPLSDESDRDSGHIAAHSMEYHYTAAEKLNGDDVKIKDDIKRKKEKRRKDKKHFVKDDDNSLDVDAVSKAIEARLFADTSNIDDIRTKMENISDSVATKLNSDHKYRDINVNSPFNKYCGKYKKDSREKKKKKKKNREDRQNRKEHHHGYHHEKIQKFDDSDIDNTMTTNKLDDPYLDNSVTLSPKTMLLDIPLPNDIQKTDVTDKSDDSKSLSESPSLPRITDSPPFAIKTDENSERKINDQDSPNLLVEDDACDIDYDLARNIEINDIPMPPPIDNIVQDISEVPLPKDPPLNIDKCKQSELTCVNIDIEIDTDVKMSEDAVRSIPILENDTEKQTDKKVSESHSCKLEKKLEEKPRAIISQEETEDAVAALLGESFGGKINAFVNCYEEVENNSTHQIEIENTTIGNEIIPEEDAEEMRQAVQNLNASEMEMKPDTPVSDSDLLLIDTDTEETEETNQDAIEKLPVNIIATNQSLNNNNKVSLAHTTEISNVIVTKAKTTIVQKESHDLNKKLNEGEVPSVTKQETIQQVTSTATPVITSPVRSWSLSNNKLIDSQTPNIPVSSMANKLIEPHMPTIPVNSLANKDHNETKPTHITANIVQIKAPHNQGLQIGSAIRPIINSNRVSAPYQVINQIIRPQVSSMQPPTIKIPEPHIIYQKPQGIVISPRISNEPILLSPKNSPRTEGMTSPRLSNMTILGSSSQNINSSSNTLQQRSPGQVTVVRMQQPPLSPIQTMHISPGARAMVSPNRPNSVLVQTQGSPLHFNRLPVTPVLAPISKQMNVNNIIQQTKSSLSNNPQLIHQPKMLSDTRKSENVNENTKIILSPTRLHQTTNSTIMAQNRLISMQNSIHVGNINSTLQLSNKVLLNNKTQLADKREIINNKSEQNMLTPIIHVATHAPSSIIQGSSKSVVCSPHEAAAVNRGHGSNVIHTVNSQRLLTANPITNVIQLEANKGPPSVLSMATIRPSQALCKSESSNTVVVTTTSLANVVMTPLLLNTSTTPKGTIRLHTRSESEHLESHSSVPHLNHCQSQHCDKNIENKDSDILKPALVPSASPTEHNIAKCETDFEELLKDNTNEIKVTNDPEKKLEVNVGKNLTLITPGLDRRKSIDCKVDEKDGHKELNTKKQYSTVDDTVLKINDEEIITSAIVEVKSIDLVENKSKQSNLELNHQEKSEVTHDVKDKIDSKKICENDISSITEVHESNHKFFSLLSSPNKGNEIKNLDEGDYWSAKDVNIESVIKKVEFLCNDTSDEKKDETNEVNGPVTKDSPEKIVTEANIRNDMLSELKESIKQDSCNTELLKEMESKTETFQECNVIEEPIIEKTTGRRGGRSGRGKRMEKSQDRVQTRQITKPPRGSSKRGRGSRAKVDKKIKNLVSNSLNNMPGDVYDFHEDSGDETVTSPNKAEVRPRLILTIKSPLSGHSNAIATSTLSITQKDQAKSIEKPKEEKVELFVSPSANTRKSRRLQEKDIQRSTVDDVIDEVIKGSATQFKNNKEANKKRSTRQAGNKIHIEKNSAGDVRKSPRGVKRTRDRSLSDASVDSSDDNVKREDNCKEPKISKPAEQPTPPKSDPETIIKTAPVGPPVITSPPPSNPIPIMKPPKKMISEIVKLAGVFEAAANINNRVGVTPPNVPDRPLPSAERPCEADRLAPPAVETSPIAAGEAGDAGYVRRIVDNVPANMMPVGATEATDARVQSPALPHRPPSAHHLADRLLTLCEPPVLVRGGEGDHGAYAGPASLPRGAHHPPLSKQNVVGPHHLHPGSRTPVTDEVRFGRTNVPAGSPQGQIGLGEGMYPHFSHHHYQMYQQHFRATQHENISTPTFLPRGALEAEASEVPTPPLELRRPPTARVPRPAHSPSPLDRHILYAVRCGRSPPPAHGTSRPPSALPPPGPSGPPHASQVPREADSLQMLLRRYPVMWQGLLALKNDSAAVQMHFVGGNPGVAADALSRHSDGAAASLLRIAQRMRLEPAQLDQVHRKMKLENEHCILLGLPCGRDHMDVLQQSTNLTGGFITYLQRKQAAGIVNVAPSPGHHQSIYTVHIFPSCDFANENLNRIAPDLMHRVANIAHLLIVIATALG